MLRIFYFILFFIVLNVNFGAAAEPMSNARQKVTLKADTSVVKIRYFDKTRLNNYSKQPEFQYSDTVVSTSLLTRIWRSFWTWFWHLFDFLQNSHRPSTFFQIVLVILKCLFVVLGVSALVFFILKLLGIDMLNIFKSNPVPANLPYSEFLENIHEIDFDSEIEKAVVQNNYRLAVRMLYLKCLKQLSDATLIKWQPDKTNSTYINELGNIEQRMAFAQLTRQFEYIWYGEFAIDSNIYKNISFMFQRFKNEMA